MCRIRRKKKKRKSNWVCLKRLSNSHLQSNIFQLSSRLSLSSLKLWILHYFCPKNKLNRALIWQQNTSSTSLSPFHVASGRENAAAFLQKTNVWISLFYDTVTGSILTQNWALDQTSEFGDYYCFYCGNCFTYCNSCYDLMTLLWLRHVMPSGVHTSPKWLIDQQQLNGVSWWQTGLSRPLVTTTCLLLDWSGVNGLGAMRSGMLWIRCQCVSGICPCLSHSLSLSLSLLFYFFYELHVVTELKDLTLRYPSWGHHASCFMCWRVSFTQ